MEDHDDKYYFNLSRKELQELCKKHGLPANRTKSHLAKLVISFLKGKNVSPAPSGEERSNCPAESSPPLSYMSDLKHEAPINSLRETIRDVAVHKKNVESSYLDSFESPSHSTENQVYDKVNGQSINSGETNCHMEAETSDKVSHSTANMLANNGTTKGFGCFTSDTRNVNMQTVASTLPKDITAYPQVGSGYAENCIEYRKNQPHNSSINSKISSESESRNIKVGSQPEARGLVSPNENSPERPPVSFQFFVRSDEGINLCVDLCSSPSDWVKSLKDEVCIYQKVQHTTSGVLQQEPRTSRDGVDQIKTSPVKCPEMIAQTEGTEGDVDIRCIKSSLRSIVSQICNSGVTEPLRFCTVTSTDAPAEMLGHQEDNCIISTPFLSDSNIQNQMGSDIVSCPKEGEIVTQSSPTATSKMDKSSMQLHDTSLNNLASNMDVNFKTDRPVFSGSLECHMSKTASGYPESAEADIVSSNIVTGVSEKQDTQSCREQYEDFSSADIGTPEKQSGASCSKEILSTPVTLGCEEISALHHQLSDQSGFDSPMSNREPEKGGSTNHQFEKEAGDRLGSPVIGDATSVLPQEQGSSNLTNERETSESEKPTKRKRTPESQEGLKSKRQCNDSEIHGSGHATPTMKNLRSAKNLAREPLLPRRSKRLVSK